MRFKIIAFLLILATLAFAQDKRRIGLIPFINNSGDSGQDWISYGFEYYLYGKLSVVGGFYVPDKKEFHKALNKANFDGKNIDERLIYHAGKYGKVEVIVSGDYTLSGNTLTLNVAYSNAANGTPILTDTIVQPLDNFFEMGKKITNEIINLAGISVSATERNLLNFTFTHSIKAYKSFIQAYMENEKPNGRIEKVTGLFRRAIREDATFWEAYYNLGIVYFNSGSYAQALEQFDKVIKALPGFDKPYFGRGLIYEKQKKYKLAIEDFKRVTKFNPNDYKPYYYLGKISIKDKSYKAAKDYLNHSIKLNPDYAKSYFQLGNIYYVQKKYRKAISYYKKAVKLNDKNAKYHLKLGDTYYRSQIFYNALEEIDASIALDPTNYVSYFLRGITVYKLAVLEELVNAFLDILSETPTTHAKEAKPGKFHKDTAIDPVAKKQVYLDMATAFENAIKLRPSFMEATFNLALTYYEMGNYADAEKYFLRTIQLNPNLIRAHMKLAELYSKQHRKQEAIEQYRRVFYIQPAIFVSHPTLGPEFQYINILNKFRSELENEVNRNPNNPQNNLLLAKLFYAQGHYGKAANLARKVLSISPSNKSAKNLLKKIKH